MRPKLISTLAAVILVAAALPAWTDYCDNRVDLALVLAVDESDSIEEAEWNLERQGYVAAFSNPDLLDAITSGPCGRIAVTMMVWAGGPEQKQITGWRVIENAESSLGFAEEVAHTQRTYKGSTAINNAIKEATKLLTQGFPYLADTKKIDISGDGENNVGPDNGLILAREHAVSLGIVINGLPIRDITSSSGLKYPVPADINAYFRDKVIAGPGAFYEPVEGYEDFTRAIYRKLVLEIAWAK